MARRLRTALVDVRSQVFSPLLQWADDHQLPGAGAEHRKSERSRGFLGDGI